MEIVDLPSLQKNKEEFQLPKPIGWDIFFEEETFDCIIVLDIDYTYLQSLITYDNETKSIKLIHKLNPMLVKYPKLCKTYSIDVGHIKEALVDSKNNAIQWLKNHALGD